MNQKAKNGLLRRRARAQTNQPARLSENALSKVDTAAIALHMGGCKEGHATAILLWLTLVLTLAERESVEM